MISNNLLFSKPCLLVYFLQIKNFVENNSIKKLVLNLRWAVIILVSYLILLAKGKVVDTNLSYLIIIIYLASNIILIFFPNSLFSNQKFFYPLIIFDTSIVSVGMYLSEKMITDFYIVFFLIIIFASITRNFKLLMIIGAFTSGIYGLLLYSWGLLLTPDGGSYFLRIPFIFIMTAFYGYIVQTLTKEKRYELTISEDKYRSLFENANDGIIIIDAKSLNIIDINIEVERSLGYKKDELINKNFLTLINPEEKNKTETLIEKLKQLSGIRTDEVSLIKKDGSSIEVDISAKKIDLGKESFYQVIFRDLTQQRILEKKIRESKRNLEAIFDGIQDQLSIQSPQYTILRVNKAVIKNYSTTFADILGKKCYEVYYNRSLPCEKCPIAITIETKKPASSVKKLTDDDKIIQIYSYPILDEQGNLISAIEYVKDITEQQRLQDQLIQSEKLAGIGILASGVAHEINNPLSGIIGMAELALEEDDPTRQKAYLTDILSCAQRIGEITNGLRSYSRMAKKDELMEIDLNEILESSLKMVSFAFKGVKVDVERQLQPNLKIKANPGEIQQVFVNLITNAFQAMNGKKGMITLYTKSLEDSVEIKIKDNGIGIPQKNLNKIFDPFFTTKKVGEGTGLGLNIVYRIVTKYEGKIEVESKVGYGTIFTIKFPKWRDSL